MKLWMLTVLTVFTFAGVLRAEAPAAPQPGGHAAGAAEPKPSYPVAQPEDPTLKAMRILSQCLVDRDKIAETVRRAGR